MHRTQTCPAALYFKPVHAVGATQALPTPCAVTLASDTQAASRPELDTIEVDTPDNPWANLRPNARGSAPGANGVSREASQPVAAPSISEPKVEPTRVFPAAAAAAALPAAVVAVPACTTVTGFSGSQALGRRFIESFSTQTFKSIQQSYASACRGLTAADLTAARQCDDYNYKHILDGATLGTTYAARHTSRAWRQQRYGQAASMGARTLIQGVGAMAVGLSYVGIFGVVWYVSGHKNFEARTAEGVRHFLVMGAALGLNTVIKNMSRNIRDRIITGELVAGEMLSACRRLDNRLAELAAYLAKHPEARIAQSRRIAKQMMLARRHVTCVSDAVQRAQVEYVAKLARDSALVAAIKRRNLPVAFRARS